MKKTFYGVMILLVVFLGVFIGCKKTETSAKGTANESTDVAKIEVQAKSQEPIIIDDMNDFEFTPGYDVLGTIFQSDFYWDAQDGQTVTLSISPDEFVYAAYTIQNVSRRFAFTKGDLVTVVFKVQPTSKYKYFDFVSIEKK